MKYAAADTSQRDPIARSVEFNGAQRQYYVRLPANFDARKKYWLLATVHGGGGDGRRHFLATGVRQAADDAGLNSIVVSPTFSKNDVLASRFPSLGEGDFLVCVVNDMRRRFNLHPKILLTGYSRGGQFCHRFALDHPDLVQAAAPSSAGTWTTPQGSLLIESIGEVDDPATFLSNPENRSLAPERLRDLFTPRVARVAGRRPTPPRQRVPFLVMCGSLDSRFEIAQQFVDHLEKAGYRVESRWPKTPHGGRDDDQYRTEFLKYSYHAVEFFVRNTQRPQQQ